jgi:hypothetical protein
MQQGSEVGLAGWFQQCILPEQVAEFYSIVSFWSLSIKLTGWLAAAVVVKLPMCCPKIFLPLCCYY